MKFAYQLRPMSFYSRLYNFRSVGRLFFLLVVFSVTSWGQSVGPVVTGSDAEWNVVSGSSDVTLAETSGGLLRGTQTSGWTAKAEIAPEQKILRDGFVSFKLLPGKALAIGLCMNSGGFERASDFGLWIREDGSIHRLSGDTAFDLNFTYIAGDSLKIERVGIHGDIVRY